MATWEEQNRKFLIKTGQIKPEVSKPKAEPKPKESTKENTEE